MRMIDARLTAIVIAFITLAFAGHWLTLMALSLPAVPLGISRACTNG